LSKVQQYEVIILGASPAALVGPFTGKGIGNTMRSARSETVENVDLSKQFKFPSFCFKLLFN